MDYDCFTHIMSIGQFFITHVDPSYGQVGYE